MNRAKLYIRDAPIFVTYIIAVGVFTSKILDRV